MRKVLCAIALAIPVAVFTQAPVDTMARQWRAGSNSSIGLPSGSSI